MQGPVDVCFPEDVTLSLRFIKVVEHGEPVLILGSDLLRGGRPLSSWNFTAVGAHTREVGKVEGFLRFSKLGAEVEVPLLNASAELSECKSGVCLHPETQALVCEVGQNDERSVPELIADICTACAQMGDLRLAHHTCHLKKLWH